jgi:hypothetical protein
VDIASASGTEDPGSNPARVLGFYGKHGNAIVYYLINIHCLCAYLRNECNGNNNKNKITLKPLIKKEEMTFWETKKLK